MAKLLISNPSEILDCATTGLSSACDHAVEALPTNFPYNVLIHERQSSLQ